MSTASQTASDGAQTIHMPLPVAMAVAAALGAVWVVLTSRTGVTYHLFPLLIVAAVPALPRLLWELTLTTRQAAFAAGAGLAVTAVGWLTIVALDVEPNATFVHGQPGGVPAEVAVLALIGAAGSLWWSRRR